MKQLWQESRGNIIGGIVVLLITFFFTWLGNVYISAGLTPVIIGGLVLLWLAYGGYLIYWWFSRRKTIAHHDENLSDQSTSTNQEKETTMISYNHKNIRTLLTEGFSAEELRTFCFDEPELRPVFDQLAAGTGKADIVQKLVEYADQRGLFDLVLSWAEEQNPVKYRRYQPYQSTPPADTAPSIEKPTAPPDNHPAKPAAAPNEESIFHPCFISYSHKDEAFAERLHTDLIAQGVKCWYASQDMRIGDKIRPTIDRSIQEHDKLLLILSKNSIDSDWVEAEVETALDKESRLNQLMLFPIRLDETVMETDKAWAAHIRRTRHIGDFSQWENSEAYQKAFKRLLRYLEQPTAST
jgi:hypothetical protein